MLKKNSLQNTQLLANSFWHCSEIIANISCSHTSMGYFNQEKKLVPMDLRFPLEVRLINNQLYVSNQLINKDKVALKDEIVAINGIPFETIKKEMYKTYFITRKY